MRNITVGKKKKEATRGPHFKQSMDALQCLVGKLLAYMY